MRLRVFGLVAVVALFVAGAWYVTSAARTPDDESSPQPSSPAVRQENAAAPPSREDVPVRPSRTRVSETDPEMTTDSTMAEAFSAESVDSALPEPDPADRAPGWQQRKGEAALARVEYPWPDLGFRIKFMPERSGYRGGTFPYERVVEIYVRDDVGVDEIAHDIAHELGHVYDWTRNTPAERETFKALRGYAAKSGWLACNACTDYETPAGDFAEVFAYWVLRGDTEFKSQVAPAPDDAQLAQLEPLLASAAR